MSFKNIKMKLRKVLPKRFLVFYRMVRSFGGNWKTILNFIFDKKIGINFNSRIKIIVNFLLITGNVKCSHTQQEIITITGHLLKSLDNTMGCIVEAGSHKGGSTAKLSIVAGILNKKLVIFDSFEGIPDNKEPHEKNIFGKQAKFSKGDYAGSLEEVKNNVKRLGNIKHCTFVKGWFENTMPAFKEPIAAIFLDVDLASSTRTCLKYLYPLLTSSGLLFSHDGHLPLVIDVFNDDTFWRTEVGCIKPHIEGLGKRKLIMIRKE